MMGILAKSKISYCKVFSPLQVAGVYFESYTYAKSHTVAIFDWAKYSELELTSVLNPKRLLYYLITRSSINLLLVISSMQSGYA